MSFNICRGTLFGEIAPEVAEAAWRRLIKCAMLGAFGERINAMNDETTDLNQVDEDILAYTVSDEALEAAASNEMGKPTSLIFTRLCFPNAFC